MVLSVRVCDNSQFIEVNRLERVTHGSDTHYKSAQDEVARPHKHLPLLFAYLYLSTSNLLAVWLTLPFQPLLLPTKVMIVTKPSQLNQLGCRIRRMASQQQVIPRCHSPSEAGKDQRVRGKGARHCSRDDFLVLFQVGNGC